MSGHAGMERLSGRFRSYAVTHPGARRRLNEDNCLHRPEIGLWAVADGVGGAEAGEVASQAVVGALTEIPVGLEPFRLLSTVRQAVQRVHADLLALAHQRGPMAMVASTVVVLIVEGDYFACLWAGDSRAYLLRDTTLQRLTRDHSLVQEWVDQGLLKAAEAAGHANANMITRAVGAGPAVLELDKVTGAVLPGDRFLLCTDGLTNTLPEAEMLALVAMPAGTSPPEVLIQAALAREARDNVTAVTVEVER